MGAGKSVVLLVIYSSDHYRFNYLLIQMGKSTHVTIEIRQSAKCIKKQVIFIMLVLVTVTLQ